MINNKLKFSIDIKTDKSSIWNAMWNKNSYRQWASVFFEGSYAVTNDWIEGSIVHFLSPDQSGIYSVIEKHIPGNIMQFKHIGYIVGGEEQPINEESNKWSGATETYTLTEGKDSVALKIEIDVMDEHLEFMKATFPQALEKIKENCSKNIKSRMTRSFRGVVNNRHIAP